jgi:hypothetical protein
MNLEQHPYYDDHDSQYEKDYKQLLFNPGRAVQARELTQSQSLIYDQLDSNFRTIYKNGTIVNGCELSIYTIDSITYATVKEGNFYANGKVYPVHEQTITIRGAGEEFIGLKIQESIVTYQEDPSLTDPAQGYYNYNNSGADRLKQVIVLDANKPGIFPLWEINDKVIIKNPNRPDYSDLLTVLARRTYDESGNYLVQGMKLNVRNDPNDSNKLIITVSSGKAYVKGYEIKFPSLKTVKVSKALDTNARRNEPKVFSTGTYDYSLNEKYVKDISEVNGEVETTVYLTKGVADSSDAIIENSNSNNRFPGREYTSIISITSITSVDGGTTYVEDTDFTLNADEIDWYLAGAEPDPGSTYKVTFKYNKTFDSTEYSLTSGTDNYYNLTFDSDLNDVSYPDNDEYPKDGSTVDVDYNYYLARVDLISVNSLGEIVVKTGPYTDWEDSVVPFESQEVLRLGYIKFMPNSGAGETSIVNYGFKRTTMLQLYYMLERLSQVEENQAQISLEDEAISGELPTELKGILVDSFNSFFKSDINTDFSAAINKILQTLEMNTTHNVYKFSYANNILDNIKEYGPNGKYNTIKVISEISAARNVYRSGSESLNPHGFLDDLTGKIECEPSSDTWIDDEYIEKEIVNNVAESKTVNTHNTSLRNTTATETEDKITEEIVTFKEEKSIEYARQIPIEITGQEWLSTCRLIAKIDDEFVSINSPSDQTWDSGNEGTVWETVNNTDFPNHLPNDGTNYTSAIVQSDGTFKGIITIPEGISTGDIEIKIINLDTENGLYSSFVFESTGLKKFYEKEIYIDRVETTVIYNYTPRYTPSYSSYSSPSPSYDVIAYDGSPTTAEVVSGTVGGIKTDAGGDSNSALTNVLASDYGTSTSSDVVAAISNLYTNITQRAPDTGGLNYWVQEAESGKSMDEITQAFTAAAKENNEPAVTDGSTNFAPPSEDNSRYVSSSSTSSDRSSSTGSDSCTNDPVAQSFFFDEDKIFTSINVYFNSVDTEEDAFMQIGYVINGYPEMKSIFHTQYFSAADIYYDLTGEMPTNIKFDKPIYIPANTYFFVSFGSKSRDWRIYIAEMGKYDLITNNYITKNPYLDGVFFTSSNNITWSALQETDLAFNLFEGNFGESGTIQTETINVPEGFSMFKYTPKTQVMEKSTIDYFYSLDEGENWKTFNPDNVIELTSVYNTLNIKMKLFGNGKYSPIVDVSQNSIVFSIYDNTSDSVYITKTVNNTPEYNEIKVILDENMPPTGSKTLKASVDDILYFKLDDTEEESIPVGSGFYRKTYSTNLDSYYKFSDITITDTISEDDTFTGSGTGTPSGTVEAVGDNEIILKLDSGTFEDTETITTSTGGSFVVDITNMINLTNNTTFKGRIDFNSSNQALSPLFKKLKYIMKKVI